MVTQNLKKSEGRHSDRSQDPDQDVGGDHRVTARIAHDECRISILSGTFTAAYIAHRAAASSGSLSNSPGTYVVSLAMILAHLWQLTLAHLGGRWLCFVDGANEA